MQKFVTDNTQGNFETVLNFVFSKDGQAYILAALAALEDWESPGGKDSSLRSE